MPRSTSAVGEFFMAVGIITPRRSRPLRRAGDGPAFFTGNRNQSRRNTPGSFGTNAAPVRCTRPPQRSIERGHFKGHEHVNRHSHRTRRPTS